MGCKGCWECLLKLLNFLMTVAGLAMVGYGIYLLVQYNNRPENTLMVPADQTLVQLGRPMLVAVNLSDSIFDNLPKVWFIYAFIGVGAILFVISCFGCIASVTRNDCCLSCYAFFGDIIDLARAGLCSFLCFLMKAGKKEIPQDETGYFDMVYGFLRENWDIVRWVALGIVVFEAVLFFLSLIVRAANKQADYDSDEEFINPRHQARQPLLTNKPASPVTGVPVANTHDQRSSRTDAWSTRMREKYGLDTSEFTYNPSESHRFPQPNPQPTEERSRCTIM